MSILEIQQISKSFGATQVLDRLNLVVPDGSLFGFVGENGAGKTTTMKMILGLEEADSGNILVKGEKVSFGNTRTNRYTGYLPDVPAFYPYMSASEYLTLCGELTGMKKVKLKKKIPEILRLVGLDTHKGRIKGFSRGMKQRLGIAQALLNDPELLICDEPTSALDPSGRNEFLELLASLKGRVTILFSTHILSDVERICDYVGILDEGKLKICTSLPELRAQYSQNKIEVVLADEAKSSLLKQLGQLPSIITVENPNQQTITLAYTGDYEESVQAIFNYLVQVNTLPISLKKIEPTLEDIFLEVVK
ncbi:ABC transporter ATP-binding protein [Candidatus Enterococcus ferrettii]|uniref:ABC-2 type transport system ATP-binding protein n=1 Tax=Candidatus Enterococcus ferrettii TaxID=2815324 RepID=A0ABV0ET28_9ENTE|nr:ABC transporter ATP-binding protein [Enterococcus sp. 665A]MBO1342606.1 ABC transporter ATP-binding protein [Enterococcus sp. 665A]